MVQQNFGKLSMKFEDYLMQPREVQKRRLALEEEVEELQEKLNGELKISSILRYALKGSILSRPGISTTIPLKVQVQVLLAELAAVEKEVLWLEKKVQNLKLDLYHEKKISKGCERKLSTKTDYERNLSEKQQNQAKYEDLEWISASSESHELCSKRYKRLEGRRFSVGSAIEMHNFSCSKSNETASEKSRRMISRNKHHVESGISEPNKLSEELLKCLIATFLNMYQTSPANEGTAAGATKQTLSWISSRGLTPRSTFNCKVRPSLNSSEALHFEPHSSLAGSYGRNKDASLYKNHIQVTRRSLEPNHASNYNPASRKLRYLLPKLCKVELALLNYKQKLAFWINIYNACIMHAYLQHGPPSTQEKMLELMNKAALNVGGIVLNALAIEHYILRHPSDSKYDPTDDKGMMLRSIYGLGYPEPNVTFALCRGNRSSPPVRVYTPDDVVNHLGTAKVEYLEASVDVTNKKKILVPKLLHWHMQDFADDMESLIEWIYSQLPQSGLLRRRMMECLSRETKLPIGKLVEIVAYDYEFRYLLPTLVKEET